MMNVVICTPDEFYLDCAKVGFRRRAKGIRDGHNKNNNTTDFKGDGWDRDVEGATAEGVFSMWSGLPWPKLIGNFPVPDVPPFHVRQTSWPNGCLIIRDSDRKIATDRTPFVLVVGRDRRYIIRGMFLASQVKDEWFRPKDSKGVAAWWVPQDALLNIDISEWVENETTHTGQRT